MNTIMLERTSKNVFRPKSRLVEEVSETENLDKVMIRKALETMNSESRVFVEIPSDIFPTLFTFAWEGALRDLKNKFSGVELQQHIKELRVVHGKKELLQGLQKEWSTILNSEGSDVELSKKRQQFMKKLFKMDEDIQKQFLEEETEKAKKNYDGGESWEDFLSGDFSDYPK